MTIYEQIFAGLQTKFQGADSSTLTRIATRKADGITDESQVKTIVDGVGFSDVLQSYGDARANDATKTSVENYEKKYSIKEGRLIEQSPIDPPSPIAITNVPDDISKLIAEEVAKGISSALKPVTDELGALKNEKSAMEFSASVSETAKKYGIPDKFMKFVKVPNDTPDLDKYMQEVKQASTDAGLQEVQSPQSAEAFLEKESETLAKQINQGTEEIVKSETKI